MEQGMNDTLKVAGRIGAELGAVKRENEKLREIAEDAGRELQAWIASFPRASHHQAKALIARISAALSQQADPSETTEAYTAHDMATAAAQGFRDGQAAVEPAPAQDERKTFEVEIPDISAIYDGRSFIPYRSLEAGERLMTVAQHLRIEKQLRAALTRPAQTEQQPVAWLIDWPEEPELGYYFSDEPNEHARSRPLYTAPIAQTAPIGKFRMGDLVKKSTGSEWVGHVCGTYSTALTPEGYAVESEAHAGSVQIYPAKALEAVDD
jgi:hypothetical protein